MEDHEFKAFIRQVIREEITPILFGTITETASQNRASARRFSNEDAIDDQRILGPYGFAGRPKKGTTCLVMPLAGDPTHLSVAASFDDKGRPDLNEGEACLYGPTGQILLMRDDGTIRQGSRGASQPAVLGNVLKACLQALTDAFLNSPSIGEGGSGPVVLSPVVRTALENALNTYVATAATNIVSQKNFLERGV